ncbi:MAG: hypothetical protein BWY29_01048 [Microgenomates group bacterium ADurb.Bin238]|nr:MAG: hypothetical protein BWY29_01048 [Microgenomates group bacterium ADurb.Bin238]
MDRVILELAAQVKAMVVVPKVLLAVVMVGLVALVIIQFLLLQHMDLIRKITHICWVLEAEMVIVVLEEVAAELLH